MFDNLSERDVEFDDARRSVRGLERLALTLRERVKEHMLTKKAWLLSIQRMSEDVRKFYDAEGKE